MVAGSEKVFQENYLIKTFVTASNDPNYKQEIVLLYGNIFETQRFDLDIKWSKKGDIINIQPHKRRYSSIPHLCLPNSCD